VLGVTVIDGPATTVMSPVAVSVPTLPVTVTVYGPAVPVPGIKP
jgi:hypothetical protein